MRKIKNIDGNRKEKKEYQSNHLPILTDEEIDKLDLKDEKANNNRVLERISLYVPDYTKSKWQNFVNMHKQDYPTISELVRKSVDTFINIQSKISKESPLKLDNQVVTKISHALKEPLTSIKAFSQLLLENYKNDLDDQVLTTIQNIFDQSIILENKLVNFLDTIRIESSQYDILLIEDDLATIRLLTSYFESKGYSCRGVVSGAKGLKELVINRPKVVLVNVILPDVNGYEICKKIKSIPKLEPIPVFFFTALPGSEVEKHLAETKADGYINKPCDLSDFDKILDLVNLHKNKDESTKNSKTTRLTDEEIEKLGLFWKQINQYITLKLEKGKTQIYVKGKKFLQCKRLVLNISKKDIPIYDEIDSIDEAADVYQKHLYQNEIVEGPLARPLHEDHDITPEQEFWGHCSNLQAWYENDYDTRLLHSNLAFYLLKALVDAGDPKANKVFKTEVAERFGSGYPNVIIFILKSKLLDYFSLEEKRELIRPNVLIILKHAPELIECFSAEEKKTLIQDNKALFYEIFKKIKLYSYPITAIFEQRLFNYLALEDQRDIIQKSYQDLLIYIESRFKPKFYRETLSYIYLIILKALKGTPLMDDFLKRLAGLPPIINLQFLNAIQELKKIDKIYWTDISELFMQFLSISPSMLYQFLRSCYRQFPTLIEDILLQILNLQNGKNIIFSIIQEDHFFIFQYHFPRLFLKVEENEIRKEILDCIEKIWALKLKNERHNTSKIVLFGDNLEKLVDCKKCGKFLTLKPLYTLLKKERVFCPNCGEVINQKFNPRDRLVYLKRVLEVSQLSN